MIELIFLSQDTNDNSPEFIDPPYDISILEDLSEYEVGEPFLTVQASDRDLKEDYGNASLR